MKLLRDYALSFVGRPYLWGGDDPLRGFDCSGFVQELLASVGADPPGDQTAQGLFDYFLKFGARADVFECGSLVFYGKSLREITHVAMLLDPFRIIEAGGGGSRTTSPEAASEQNAYIRVRHMDARRDRVAVLRPSYGSVGAY